MFIQNTSSRRHGGALHRRFLEDPTMWIGKGPERILEGPSLQTHYKFYFQFRGPMGPQVKFHKARPHFLNKDIWISIDTSLKFVTKGQINNTPALVQIMAWCPPGDKPLSEPMMVSLLMHICATRPQWVKRNTRKPKPIITQDM